MKRFCAILFVVLLAGTVFAQQPADPATKEDVQQLLALMQTRKQIDSMMITFRQQNQAMTKTMVEKITPKLTEQQKADILRHSEESFQKMMSTMPFDEMINAMIPAYQHQITHNDMQELIKFYSSPAGQRFIEKMPTLMAEAMQSAQPVMQKWLETQLPAVMDDAQEYAKAVTQESSGDKVQDRTGRLPECIAAIFAMSPVSRVA